MTTSPPAGWYPDPGVPGAQRYFDGIVWTQHFVPPPPPVPSYGWYPPPQPQWKGARFGLPVTGPGSLATPGRRLGARCLDALVLTPVFIALCVIGIVLVAPHAGPMFPTYPAGTQPGRTPGSFWIVLTIAGCFFVTGIVMVAYETVATVTWGRTLGKRWLHIRPTCTDGSALGWGRSFGRAALYWFSGFLSWIGLLDPLWCLWDGDRQCLHTKVVGSLVINDRIVPPHPVRDLRAGPTAVGTPRY